MTRDTPRIEGGAKQPSVSGSYTLAAFRATLERAESVLVDIATRLAPWLASLLVAWQTGTTGIRSLGWPAWVGWIAGASVECLGAASAHLWLDLRAYNLDAARVKSDPHAPERLALGVVGVYFVGMGALTVASTLPILRPYMMLVIPVLSAAGTLVLALRSGHVARLDGVQSEQAERKAARAESKATKAKRNLTQSDAIPDAIEPVALSLDERRAQVAELHAQGRRNLEIAQALQIPAYTVTRDLAAIGSNGHS